MELNKKPNACVGVMIWKDDRVLIGKRRWRHGDGEYSFPGGSLEYMEGFEDCAIKEVFEETGLKIKNLKFLSLNNLIKHYDRHDVLISFIADWESGEPRNLPEERIGNWGWYSLDNLPLPLFYPTQIMVEAYKSGINYYDKK